MFPKTRHDILESISADSFSLVDFSKTDTQEHFTPFSFSLVYVDRHLKTKCYNFNEMLFHVGFSVFPLIQKEKKILFFPSDFFLFLYL